MKRWRFLLMAVLVGALAVLLGSVGRSRGASSNVVPLPVSEATFELVQSLPSDSEPEPPEILLPYEGPVEHIFFHPLVIYPELAFDGDSLAQGYDDWFVTVTEFRRIVSALYERDYVLVDFATLLDQGANGGLERKPLLLPPGKRPLVISIDDLNYYEYMRENGNAYKLIVGDDGIVKTFSMSPVGLPTVSVDNEIIPILDAFVAEHPDFSIRGAKGVIALTGYEGILGYRTNDPSAPGYEQEKQEALRVVSRLKETGWSFASHGWGHLDARQISAGALARDTRRWREEVEPLVGPTSIYIYPFGSVPDSGSEKFQSLQREGFRIFCGVGPNPVLNVAEDAAYMERRHIDGMAFRTQRKLLLPFFDADRIIDDLRPKS